MGRGPHSLRTCPRKYRIPTRADSGDVRRIRGTEGRGNADDDRNDVTLGGDLEPTHHVTVSGVA